MRNNEVKKFLEDYLRLRRDAERCKEKMLELRNILEGLKSFDYSSVKVQGGQGNKDQVFDKLLETEQTYADLMAQALAQSSKVYCLIDAHTTGKVNDVLKERYCEGLPFGMIELKLNYSHAQVMRYHAHGLKKIAENQKDETK